MALRVLEPALISNRGQITRAMQDTYDRDDVIVRAVVDSVGAMEDYAQARGKQRAFWMRKGEGQ